MIDNALALPLYHQVAGILRQRMDDGIYQAGGRLLSEDELSGLVPLPARIPVGFELAEGFGSWMEALDDHARLAVTVAAASPRRTAPRLPQCSR